MTKTAVVCCSWIIFSAMAWGQIPGGNVFIGYSYTQTNLTPGQSTSLNGWNGSLEAKVLPFIGVVADVSGHYGSQSLIFNCPGGVTPCLIAPVNADVSEYNVLFGPRVSFRIRKFRPFVHALIGVGHVGESATGFSNSDTSFSDAIGGGLDYHLIPLISWRVQGDALQTRFFGTSQNNVRFSTGIVVSF